MGNTVSCIYCVAPLSASVNESCAPTDVIGLKYRLVTQRHAISSLDHPISLEYLTGILGLRPDDGAETGRPTTLLFVTVMKPMSSV